MKRSGEQPGAGQGNGERNVEPIGAQVSPAVAEAQASVQADFEAFGLSGYEARVLVALLRVGSATPAQLARLSGVHRTSAYPVLEELATKGLAEVRPGKTAVWASPGPEEVIIRLNAMQEERLHSLQSRLDQTRLTLTRLVAKAPAAPLPYAQIIRGAAQVRRIYERMLREAKSEVLVFNRPPYTWTLGRINPVVLETLARGVKARVVYQAAQLEGAEAEAFRAETNAYLAAGLQARVVDELPVKLAVVDKSSVLFAMPEPMALEEEFPTNLLVEHPGFVAMQARAFQQVWDEARPLRVERHARADASAG